MMDCIVAVPISSRFYVKNPIEHAFAYAEDNFGEFYELSRKAYEYDSPVVYQRFLIIKAKSKIKPIYTEQLESFIERL
jgi:hypothetical protein